MRSMDVESARAKNRVRKSENLQIFVFFKSAHQGFLTDPDTFSGPRVAPEAARRWQDTLRASQKQIETNGNDENHHFFRRRRVYLRVPKYFQRPGARARVIGRRGGGPEIILCRVRMPLKTGNDRREGGGPKRRREQLAGHQTTVCLGG